MAVNASRVTVGTTAALLSRDRDNGAALIRNRGAGAVFLGESDVTAAEGFQVDPGETVAIDLNQEAVWAISESGSNVLHVLRVGA